MRTPRHTILIGTATSNGKRRPYVPMLDHLQEPFLARPAAAGIPPGRVDTVLLTHRHADHVGWNIHRLDGHWAPTFPNARDVLSRVEQAYNEVLADGRPLDGEGRPSLAPGPAAGTPSPGVYDGKMSAGRVSRQGGHFS